MKGIHTFCLLGVIRNDFEICQVKVRGSLLISYFRFICVSGGGSR